MRHFLHKKVPVTYGIMMSDLACKGEALALGCVVQPWTQYCCKCKKFIGGPSRDDGYTRCVCGDGDKTPCQCPSVTMKSRGLEGFDGLTWKGYLYFAAIGGLITSGAMVGMQYMQQQKTRIEAKEKKEKAPEEEPMHGPAIAGFIMGAIIYPAWKFIATN